MIGKSIFCLACAVLIWTAFEVYRMVRFERMNTRIALSLADGEHEIAAALPAGAYEVSFTAKANLPISGGGPDPLFAAEVTTAIIQDVPGGVIVPPTSRQSFSFSLSRQQAFRPTRLRVKVVRHQPSSVYLHVAPSL